MIGCLIETDSSKRMQKSIVSQPGKWLAWLERENCCSLSPTDLAKRAIRNRVYVAYVAYVCSDCLAEAMLIKLMHIAYLAGQRPARSQKPDCWVSALVRSDQVRSAWQVGGYCTNIRCTYRIARQVALVLMLTPWLLLLFVFGANSIV